MRVSSNSTTSNVAVRLALDSKLHFFLSPAWSLSLGTVLPDSAPRLGGAFFAHFPRTQVEAYNTLVLEFFRAHDADHPPRKAT